MMTDLKGDMATLAGNMAAVQEMERLRVLLEQAGVEIILLKGAAFLDTLYPDLSERRMCDLDFLIRKEDKSKTWELLQAEGYTRRHYVDRPNFSQERTEFTYISEETGIQLDVHWELGHLGRHQINYSDVWQQAVSYPNPSRSIPTLSPEYSLIFIAIHEACDLFQASRKAQVDLTRLLENWETCWETVIRLAKSSGSEIELYILLKKANLPTFLVPERVLTILAPKSLRLMLCKKLLRMSNHPPRHRWDYYIHKLVVLFTCFRLGVATSSLGRVLAYNLKDLYYRIFSRSLGSN